MGPAIQTSLLGELDVSANPAPLRLERAKVNEQRRPNMVASMELEIEVEYH
jgi:hypothetical protein